MSEFITKRWNDAYKARLWTEYLKENHYDVFHQEEKEKKRRKRRNEKKHKRSYNSGDQWIN